MVPQLVEGNLLDQQVEVIVNSWNRNIIPWWLLLPQGVSGAIKKRAGLQPFREVAKAGPIPLGDAVLTSPGALPFKGIIHVAGIDGFWRASEFSIRHCVTNAMKMADDHHFRSIALPIIGAGSGNFNREKALHIMLDEFASIEFPIEATIVRFVKR